MNRRRRAARTKFSRHEMTSKSKLKQSYAYDGGKLCMLDENTLVSKSGNALSFTSIALNTQHFYQRSTTDPISSFDVCWKSCQLAIASSSIEPEIQIISYPECVSVYLYVYGYVYMYMCRCMMCMYVFANSMIEKSGHYERSRPSYIHTP